MRRLAERIVRPLQGLRNPTRDQIERALLLINDIPGITRAAAVPKPGDDARGAIDLHVNVEREALGGLNLVADDRVHVAFPAVEGVRRDPCGAFQCRLGLRRWRDVFNASRAGVDQLSRQDGDGEFRSVRAELERTVPLPPASAYGPRAGVRRRTGRRCRPRSSRPAGRSWGRASIRRRAAGTSETGASAELRWAETLGGRGWRAPAEVCGFAEVRNLGGGAPVHAATVSTDVGVTLPRRDGGGDEARGLGRGGAGGGPDAERVVIDVSTTGGAGPGPGTSRWRPQGS